MIDDIQLIQVQTIPGIMMGCRFRQNGVRSKET